MRDDVVPYEGYMPLLDVSKVIELEKVAADNGTSLLTLMRRAGNAVAEAADKIVGSPTSSAKRVVILAGSGNNGGDGWVAASDLAAKGHDVVLVSRSPAEELCAEPAKPAAIEAAQADSFNIVLSPSKEDLGSLLHGASLMIDAILGTGFAHAEVRQPYCEWIDRANAARIEHGVPILAVDCPSGLNAQTGQAAKSCIRADTTLTMIAAKKGLAEQAASGYVGKLLVAPLGISMAT